MRIELEPNTGNYQKSRIDEIKKHDPLVRHKEYSLYSPTNQKFHHVYLIPASEDRYVDCTKNVACVLDGIMDNNLRYKLFFAYKDLERYELLERETLKAIAPLIQLK